MSQQSLPSSFRDPSGFLFEENGKVLRRVNLSYREEYNQLMESGLYESLTTGQLLIPHREVVSDDSDCYKILEPTQLTYISYPYEWSFSQLKDAALLTLQVQVEALKFGMSLKDASAYNVQFHSGKPVFIDTLSFEKYEEGKAWVAYRQYCQHFLAPLALMAQVDHRLSRLLQSFIDGIPLDLASQMLPTRSWLKYSLLAHIHLHAKTQQRFDDVGREQDNAPRVTVSRARLEGLLASLQSATEAQLWKQADTEWGNYYQDTNYIDKSMQHKEQLVARYLLAAEKSDAPMAADFGANTGRFSRIAMDNGFLVLAHDIDVVAVDKNYRGARANNETSILPLVQDLSAPSPAIGWANQERMSFGERHSVDVGMALAIIHHIHISNNVPLMKIAEYFSTVCAALIIEFVPKSDSQVIRLLSTREDIFPDYTVEGFEQAFSKHFRLVEKEKIMDSERTLYLLQRH